MSAGYWARVLDFEAASPKAEEIAELLRWRGIDWCDAADGYLDLPLAESSGRAFVEALAAAELTAPETVRSTLLSPATLQALSSQRLDLTPTEVSFDVLPVAWLAATVLREHGAADIPAVPCQRILIECVTIHDVGLPSSSNGYEGHADERRFILRLLTDADDVPDLEQPISNRMALHNVLAWSSPLTPEADDDISGIVWAVRRRRLITIEYDDVFWLRHRNAWWANTPVHPDQTLRTWLGEPAPSDYDGYQVATYEAYLHPCWLKRPRTEPFHSAAFWTTG